MAATGLSSRAQELHIGGETELVMKKLKTEGQKSGSKEPQTTPKNVHQVVDGESLAAGSGSTVTFGGVFSNQRKDR